MKNIRLVQKLPREWLRVRALSSIITHTNTSLASHSRTSSQRRFSDQTSSSCEKHATTVENAAENSNNMRKVVVNDLAEISEFLSTNNFRAFNSSLAKFRGHFPLLAEEKTELNRILKTWLDTNLQGDAAHIVNTVSLLCQCGFSFNNDADKLFLIEAVATFLNNQSHTVTSSAKFFILLHEMNFTWSLIDKEFQNKVKTLVDELLLDDDQLTGAKSNRLLAAIVKLEMKWEHLSLQARHHILTTLISLCKDANEKASFLASLARLAPSQEELNDPQIRKRILFLVYDSLKTSNDSVKLKADLLHSLHSLGFKLNEFPEELQERVITSTTDIVQTWQDDLSSLSPVQLRDCLLAWLRVGDTRLSPEQSAKLLTALTSLPLSFFQEANGLEQASFFFSMAYKFFLNSRDIGRWAADVAVAALTDRVELNSLDRRDFAEIVWQLGRWRALSSPALSSLLLQNLEAHWARFSPKEHTLIQYGFDGLYVAPFNEDNPQALAMISFSLSSLASQGELFFMASFFDRVYKAHGSWTKHSLMVLEATLAGIDWSKFVAALSASPSEWTAASQDWALFLSVLEEESDYLWGSRNSQATTALLWGTELLAPYADRKRLQSILVSLRASGMLLHNLPDSLQISLATMLKNNISKNNIFSKDLARVMRNLLLLHGNLVQAHPVLVDGLAVAVEGVRKDFTSRRYLPEVYSSVAFLTPLLISEEWFQEQLGDYQRRKSSSQDGQPGAYESLLRLHTAIYRMVYRDWHGECLPPSSRWHVNVYLEFFRSMPYAMQRELMNAVHPHVPVPPVPLLQHEEPLPIGPPENVRHTVGNRLERCLIPGHVVMKNFSGLPSGIFPVDFAIERAGKIIRWLKLCDTQKLDPIAQKKMDFQSQLYARHHRQPITWITHARQPLNFDFVFPPSSEKAAKKPRKPVVQSSKDVPPAAAKDSEEVSSTPSQTTEGEEIKKNGSVA